MAENVGVIAFAYGQQRAKTAGPSNEVIGSIALYVKCEEQKQGREVQLATQWEVDVYCDEQSQPADLRVSEYCDAETHYIDTKRALDDSLVYFKKHRVTRIILVGHSLHLWSIRLLIATKQWDVGTVTIDTRYKKRMLAVPFDKSLGNQQRWTRGPIVFIAYLVKVLLTKKHGR